MINLVAKRVIPVNQAEPSSLLGKFLKDFEIVEATFPDEASFKGSVNLAHRLVWRGTYLFTEADGGKACYERYLIVFIRADAIYQRYLVQWDSPHGKRTDIILPTQTISAQGEGVMGYQDLTELLSLLLEN